MAAPGSQSLCCDSTIGTYNLYAVFFATTGTSNAIVSVGHMVQAVGLCTLQPRPATEN